MLYFPHYTDGDGLDNDLLFSIQYTVHFRPTFSKGYSPNINTIRGPKLIGLYERSMFRLNKTI